MASEKMGCLPAGIICGVILWIVVSIGNTSGSSPAPPSQTSDIERAAEIRSDIEYDVKKFLKDPDSAVFTHLPNGCGFVRSRNGFGGMSDDQGFLIVNTGFSKTVWLEEMDPRKFKRLWRNQCQPTLAPVQPGHVDQAALDKLFPTKKHHHSD